jgi:hypothetical protein
VIDKPGHPVGQVLQTHDLHAFSRFAFFFTHHVGNQAINWQDEDQQHKEW